MTRKLTEYEDDFAYNAKVASVLCIKASTILSSIKNLNLHPEIIQNISAIVKFFNERTVYLKGKSKFFAKLNLDPEKAVAVEKMFNILFPEGILTSKKESK